MYHYLLGLGTYAIVSVVAYLATYSGPWLDLYARLDTGKGVNRTAIQVALSVRWWVIAYVMAFFCSLLVMQMMRLDADALSAFRWGMLTLHLLYVAQLVFGESVSGSLEILLKGPGGLILTWIGSANGWHLAAAPRACGL